MEREENVDMLIFLLCLSHNLVWTDVAIVCDLTLEALGFLIPVKYGGVHPFVKFDPDHLEDWNVEGW